MSIHVRDDRHTRSLTDVSLTQNKMLLDTFAMIYAKEEICLPYKKSHKSKKNPATSLTNEQKSENQALSKIRMFVENTISSLKRYNILIHRFRNHKKNLMMM